MNLHVAEQMVDVVSNNFFDRNEVGHVPLHDFVKPWNVAGNLDERRFGLCRTIARYLGHHAQQESIILEDRKRVVGIEQHGRQHRIYRPNEIAVDDRE